MSIVVNFKSMSKMMLPKFVLKFLKTLNLKHFFRNRQLLQTTWPDRRRGGHHRRGDRHQHPLRDGAPETRLHAIRISGEKDGQRRTEKDIEGYRNTQKYIEGYRKTLKDIERHRKTQKDTKYTKRHRKT